MSLCRLELCFIAVIIFYVLISQCMKMLLFLLRIWVSHGGRAERRSPQRRCGRLRLQRSWYRWSFVRIFGWPNNWWRNGACSWSRELSEFVWFSKYLEKNWMFYFSGFFLSFMKIFIIDKTSFVFLIKKIDAKKRRKETKFLFFFFFASIFVWYL